MEKEIGTILLELLPQLGMGAIFAVLFFMERASVKTLTNDWRTDLVEMNKTWHTAYVEQTKAVGEMSRSLDTLAKAIDDKIAP